MTLRIPTLIHNSFRGTLLLALLSSLAAATPLLAGGVPGVSGTGVGNDGSSQLVQTVQNSTRQFANVNAAIAAGYQKFLGCVSGPDEGAMGVHYVNGALINGKIDPTHPQAVIYEPSHGKMQLVAVEFIVFQSDWDPAHPEGPPVLDGQSFQFVGSPNRFGIPAFYELHVWAWRNNPLGTFVDWNPKVSCAGE
jgi:hypothetical protein